MADLTEEVAKEDRIGCKCQDCRDFGYIYFIAGGEFIKIGFTKSIDQRMKRLSTSGPAALELLHVEVGTLRTEKIFHRRFSEVRAHGEWFRHTAELDAFIEQRKHVREITGGL